MARIGVGLTAAAIISGVTTYVVLLLVARHLTLDQNATFLVFWGAMSLGFGVFTSIQSDATRAAAIWSRTGTEQDAPNSAPRVVTLLCTAGLISMALVAGTSPLWSEHLFTYSAIPLACIAAVGLLGASSSAAFNAVLVGHGRTKLFALVIVLDGLVRLVLVSLAVAFGGSLIVVALAAMAPSFVWLLPWAASPASRVELTRTRVDRGVRSTLWAWAQTVFASICTSALIVGFPVLARLASTEHEFSRAAPILLAILLVRGPLLLPLGAMQTVIIGHVAKSATTRLRVPAAWALRGVGAAVAATSLAAIVGPPLLRMAHEDYVVTAESFAAIALGAAALAGFTLASTIVLGRGRHSQYLSGWVVALAAAMLVLWAPMQFETRIVVSLLVGPVAGMLMHAIATAARRIRVT